MSDVHIDISHLLCEEEHQSIYAFIVFYSIGILYAPFYLNWKVYL